jgi:phosphohistidine phosphatase
MARLELYLIRHGVAADAGEKYPDDASRPLTRQGIAELTAAAHALEALDTSFDLIITSPLVRARQTADIFAAEMTTHAPVVESDALAPEGNPEAVRQEIARLAGRARIALVGHEPNLGELAAHLLGATGTIAFKKGSICRIDFDAMPPERAGRLRWLVTPAMLCRMV